MAAGPLIKRIAATLCAVALLAGCDSGAISGPDAGGTSSAPAGNGGGGNGGGGDGNGGGGDGGDRYGFGLPSGPTEGDPLAGQVYDAIRAGNCDEAEHLLSQAGHQDLLSIGIALCRGNRRTARARLGAYQPDFDLADGNKWFLCELYRASRSVVYQRPRSAFGGCPSPSRQSAEPSAPEFTSEPPTPGPSVETPVPSVSAQPASPESSG